ncbi:hypothetical protein ACIO1C_08795 [Streptomyces sp. NPDC087420]|uniref:hypothetical protein n=1 Tax=Streptomyces sp. NPDC087420 TaxID=3365785 RepID=UPI003833575A
MNVRVDGKTSARETGTALLGARRSAQQRGGSVPYIARWSGERDSSMPVVFRRDRRGIAYADERFYDRDGYGVLWSRTPSQPGRGTPEYGKVHSLRQRLCMTDLRCQVCGGPADRNPNGVLWLIDAGPQDLPHGPEHTAHPPVCRHCACRSLRACPHLRVEHVALRVRTFTPYGVSGALFHATSSGPRPYDAGTVPLADPRLPWLRAGQLLMSLDDFTVIDLTDLAA